MLRENVPEFVVCFFHDKKQASRLRQAFICPWDELIMHETHFEKSWGHSTLSEYV